MLTVVITGPAIGLASVAGAPQLVAVFVTTVARIGRSAADRRQFYRTVGARDVGRLIGQRMDKAGGVTGTFFFAAD